MKIYTKSGDKGETSLLGGNRVKKYDLRINSYGTVDELNSWIGLLRDQKIDKTYVSFLLEIQDKLFTIGSHLASLGNKSQQFTIPEINASTVTLIETNIDALNLELPPMTNFILPGGHPTVSYCHIARTVCRRCERLVIELADQENVEAVIIQYFNRLSDYLFVLGRKLAVDLNAEEIPWNSKK